MAEDAQEPTATTLLEDGEAIPRLEAQVADLKGQLLRVLADRENDRRRAARDRDEAVRYAAWNVVKDLLPAIDNLRQSIAAMEDVPERAEDELLASLLSGIEITERSLLDAFARHGIGRVDPAPGERFDPNRHHAMAEVESAEVPAGTVVQLLRPGYTYHDRLLRPALVSVAKAGGGSPSE